jgi:pimeloyl-ACP methyl ester carboxylesterase
MHEEAEVLDGVLEAAGITDALLVGHSDGASIALIRAAAGDPRVRGLLLEAPHVFVEDVTVRSIAALEQAYRESDLPARFRRHHGAGTDATVLGWTGVWLRPAFREWSIEALLARVRVPALVVQGADDEYGTLEQVERLRRGSGGPVDTLVLARCGHSPHRDRPEAVLGAMTGWIRGRVGESGAGTRKDAG